jgi:hypothetical protein
MSIRTKQMDRIDAAHADVTAARGGRNAKQSARAKAALAAVLRNSTREERGAWASRANRRAGW